MKANKINWTINNSSRNNNNNIKYTKTQVNMNNSFLNNKYYK